MISSVNALCSILKVAVIFKKLKTIVDLQITSQPWLGETKMGGESKAQELKTKATK